MRFTTRMTLLFALVLGAFVLSSLPVTAALLRGAVGPAPRAGAAWERVGAAWAGLDPETRRKAADLMEAVTDWKAAAATPSLEGDARYLRVQTSFLMFSTFQALVLLALVVVGLRILMAPVRNMARVVTRLRDGDHEARLGEGGGTEWKALARQFNAMLDRNRTLSRLQGWQEVAAFLSHQIKNPLTSISFAGQNIRALVPDLSPEAAANLDIIADQGRRINNLVRRLRDLTSFEALAPAEVELSGWMETWAASRRREGEVWDLDSGPPGSVSLVVLLWEQALDNLLANSREARTGPGPLVLHIRVAREGSLVSVDWSDGNRLADGVPLDLVGTARFTTKKEGSGLGVFFIRRIAELHGGGLTASRTPAGGLRFVLTLEGGAHGPDPRRR